MNKPADITDPVIAKAYAHPLRIEIMGALDNRVASPRQLAADLGSPLSLTSYDVRQLAKMGLVKLVSRRQKRGKKAAGILADALAQLDRLKAEEAATFEDDPHAEGIEATAVMLLFESPPAGFDAEEVGPLIEVGDLDDAAPSL